MSHEWKKRLKSFQYPALVLILGLLLMLIPSGSGNKDYEEGEGSSLEEVLNTAAGVGRVRILLSEKGAVIVCDGADNACVRLDILRAVGSYTGFGSDRITVLKMTDYKGR